MGRERPSEQLDERGRRLRRAAFTLTVAAILLLAFSIGTVAASAANGSPSSTFVLEQLLNGQVQCVSNDATCTQVNLFGQNGNPNSPPLNRNGDQRTTTVELLNAGSLAASSLTLSPGACVNNNLDPALGDADLCATVSVTVSCTTGGSTFFLGPQTLTAFGEEGTQTVNAGLGPGASTTCTFTINYPAFNPTAAMRLEAVLPVTWTLTESAVLPPTPTTPPTPMPSAPAPAPPGVVAPGAATPSPVPGQLAFTGINALALALAGLALFVVGRVLTRLSRRPNTPEPHGGGSSGT